ncbi:MAG: hypothetical protein LBF75_00555 [Treponema sp.]|jgi:hypothetical protein|nr:hypothetical protein [Treponema sp.]
MRIISERDAGILFLSNSRYFYFLGETYEKVSWVLLGIGLLMITVMMGCATTGEPLYQDAGGLDESVVIIQRKKAFLSLGKPMEVHIDGEYRTSVANGQEARIAVPNGDHTIYIGESSSMPFSVNHEEVTFQVKGLFKGAVTQTSKQPLP